MQEKQIQKETTWLKDIHKEFKSIQEGYEHDDQTREKIITISRDIIRPSKQAIYAVHRNDLHKADLLLTKAKEHIKKAHELLEQSHLNEVGSFKAGVEEFIEASCYILFSKERRIPSRKELGLPFQPNGEIYLLAISDFTGELVRKAIAAATENQQDVVKHIAHVIRELHGLFLEFDFRSGELRKKSDSLKHNLSKIEGIMYDLHVKR